MSKRNYINSEILNWIYVTFVFIALTFTSLTRTTARTPPAQLRPAEITQRWPNQAKAYNVKNEETEKGEGNGSSVQI